MAISDRVLAWFSSVKRQPAAPASTLPAEDSVALDSVQQAGVAVRAGRRRRVRAPMALQHFIHSNEGHCCCQNIRRTKSFADVSDNTYSSDLLRYEHDRMREVNTEPDRKRLVLERFPWTNIPLGSIMAANQPV